MQGLSFWKRWPLIYRLVGYLLAFCFIISLFAMWYWHFTGVDAVVNWQKLQEQKALETTVHTFRAGPFQLEVPADSYVIFEYFNGSNVIPNDFSAYSFLLILALSATILFALISVLDGIWYLIGATLGILFLVSLRLEVLGLFGTFHVLVPGAIIAFYTLVSIYFNKLSPRASLIRRIVVFLFLTLSLAVLIAVASTVPLPFYQITLTAYTSGLVLAILFIITVAHEIVASFVLIAGQGKNSLRDFSIISGIFLLNLLITCLHEIGVIQWNFVYLNLYLLLTLAGLLGLWGFRQRQPLYAHIIPFNPYGAYYYLCMGCVCFAYISYLEGNANDPAIRIIRDFIIFSQTGFTLIFLTYFFANFGGIMSQSLSAHKVLYSPRTMPYFTYRFAGLIAMLAFVFYSNWREYVYHGLSGFYNGAGDLHTRLGNDGFAEAFYERARNQGFRNHRANYQLGVLKGAWNNFEGAAENYDLANGLRPSEYSFINRGNLEVWQGHYFNSIPFYGQGLDRFPNSGRLYNNIGFAYAKVLNLDSAVKYLNRAMEVPASQTSAQTNFFALAATELIPLKVDSILNYFGSSDPGVLANAFALANLKGERLRQPPRASPRQLNLQEATLINNYIINSIINNVIIQDTAFIRQVYIQTNDSLNADFSEALKATLAFAYYHTGNVTKALEILGELAFISRSYQGTFNYIKGLWALENNSPLIASSYFNYAKQQEFKQGRLYHAIALTEAGMKEESLNEWTYLRDAGNEAEREIASRMIRLLTLPFAQANGLPDGEKYQYIRYGIRLVDEARFDQLVNSFQNSNYRAQSLLERSKQFYEKGDVLRAAELFNRLSNATVTDQNLRSDIRRNQLKMWAEEGNMDKLENELQRKDPTLALPLQEDWYYQALIHQHKGEKEAAVKLFQLLSTNNPYFEEGVIAAAGFFADKGLTPYNILAEAIQVNTESPKLLRAYIREATRNGFDEFAEGAEQRLRVLENL